MDDNNCRVMPEHCWHADGTDRERCCWCGDYREAPVIRSQREIHHGAYMPHPPRWQQQAGPREIKSPPKQHTPEEWLPEFTNGEGI